MSLIEPDIRAQIKLMTYLEGSSSTVEEPPEPQIRGSSGSFGLHVAFAAAPPVWLLGTGKNRVAQHGSQGAGAIRARPNTA